MNIDKEEIQKERKFSEILEDNSGGFSSIRFICLTWTVGVFLIWASCCLFGLYLNPNEPVKMIAIPNEVITIMLSCTGFKVVQRFGEK